MTEPVTVTEPPASNRSPAGTTLPAVTRSRVPSGLASLGVDGSDVNGAHRLDELAMALTSTTARIDTLTDAMVTLRSFVNERMGDVGDVVTRSQSQVTRDIGEAIDRAQSQTTRQLNEALLEAQAQATSDLEEAAAEARTQTTRQLATAFDRLESLATRRTANDERRHEQTTAALKVALTESRAHSQRVAAEISALSESVADALTQVADRLERLAINNQGRPDLVETVAQALDDVAARLDDLDSSNRSRHDRVVGALADLRSKRSQAPPGDLEAVTTRLGRIETFVEALVDAADDSTGAGTAAAAVGRLEDLEAAIGDRFSEVAASAVRSLSDAAERAASQIKAAAPPATERSTLAAMTRIEGRMAEMSRQREEHEEAAKEVLDNLEETVSRLASAQAEDLERILDTVEGSTGAAKGASVSLSTTDAERLARIEDGLHRLNRQQKVVNGSAAIDGTALEQMVVLSNQIEALRRRMAVRARPQAPVLDADTLEAVAEAVVARLAPGPDAPPARSRPRRAPTTARQATGQRRRPEA
ncbi:MAG: hypothetical protein M3063_06830 [Actinomycetota bacterium]|nr:hypothetical protein [Actinomycetota bacterium]